MDTIIRETLRPFGITRNYRGYPQTVRAIALVLEDESRLLNVTEEIYEVVKEAAELKIGGEVLCYVY